MREALKLALEALELANNLIDGYYQPVHPVTEAITAIKQALAAPTVQEPAAWVTGLHAGRCVIQTVNPAAILPVGIALYTHPAPAAQQEFECPRCGHCCGQRQWVGLTDEEIGSAYEEAAAKINYCAPSHVQISRAIEAKLKEKNT